jgi:DNA-binding transcriptional ArsR family regulator
MIRRPRIPSRSARQAIISMGSGHAFVVTMDSFERLLWWLFAGSAGARTRALVLFDLRDQPKNAQQLSQSLHLDYTTVRHHLRVLEANKVVLAEGDKYGRVYFVSETMESHWPTLEGILKRARGKAKELRG